MSTAADFSQIAKAIDRAGATLNKMAKILETMNENNVAFAQKWDKWANEDIDLDEMQETLGKLREQRDLMAGIDDLEGKKTVLPIGELIGIVREEPHPQDKTMTLDEWLTQPAKSERVMVGEDPAESDASQTSGITSDFLRIGVETGSITEKQALDIEEAAKIQRDDEGDLITPAKNQLIQKDDYVRVTQEGPHFGRIGVVASTQAEMIEIATYGLEDLVISRHDVEVVDPNNVPDADPHNPETCEIEGCAHCDRDGYTDPNLFEPDPYDDTRD